jgi:putative membrane protein
MNTRLHRFLQFMVLGGLAVFLSLKYSSGNLVWYINQRYMPLTAIAIIGFLGMALAAILSITRSVHHHAHEEEEQGSPAKIPLVSSVVGIIILSIPLLLGIAVPAKPLTASMINTKGMSASAPLSSGGAKKAVLDISPEDRTVLDWIKIFNNQTDISRYLGQKANVIGFVYDDPRLPEGHFLVARFAITCCVADAMAIGMAVQSPDAKNLQDNTWVDVKGPVQSIEIGGQKLPLILAESVTQVNQPQQPYLFP